MINVVCASQAKETLKMLEGASQNSTNKYHSGLQQVASAFGIVGKWVWFNVVT